MAVAITRGVRNSILCRWSGFLLYLRSYEHDDADFCGWPKGHRCVAIDDVLESVWGAR
jgi:hypothetical protein